MQFKKLKKKRIPDDALLVCCGFFTGVLFIWGNMNCIYSAFDFYVYIVIASSFFVGPLCYSCYVVYKSKKK